MQIPRDHADQYVVITDNNSTSCASNLGAIGRKIAVSNQSLDSLNVIPNDTDMVNGSTDAVPIETRKA